MTHSANESFAQSQRSGFWMLTTMAVALLAFAFVVGNSLPVSKGLKLAPMDADEVAAQMASGESSNN